MTKTTAELDTKQEEAPSKNGWQSFDDDATLLKHILSKESAEELIEVPEWNVKLLCKTLDARGRMAVEAKAYDKATKTTDYRRAFDLVVIYGCFNPISGKRFFEEKHAAFLQANGGPTVRLAAPILRLSRMLADDAENAKKN